MRKCGVGIVGQVAAQEIVEASDMAGVGNVFEPGGAEAGDSVEIFDCARSQAPLVFLSKVSSRHETD